MLILILILIIRSNAVSSNYFCQPGFFRIIRIFFRLILTILLTMSSMRGWLFGFLLFITSLLGSIFILIPFVPLTYIAPRLWRFCGDRFVGYWLTFPASLCDFVFRVRFHVSGDLIERQEPALIIMNHRTRLDWLFFWNALYKMDGWLLTTEKISLKAPLKLIPGAGWAMGCGAYMFLERHIKNDEEVMDMLIDYYSEVGGAYQLLLFPEGTDLGGRAVFLSDSYAEKNGLPKYQFVLHPRTTGFTHLLRTMREKAYVKYVYDVTVGYPDKVVSTEWDLMRTGCFPKEVHFDVRKYEAAQLPEKDEDLRRWLTELWKQKELRLKVFYEADVGKRKFTPSGEGYVWPVETAGVGYYCAFLFWILTSVMWIYFAVCSFFVKIFIVLSCAFYIFCQKRYRGFEFFAIEMWKKRCRVKVD